MNPQDIFMNAMVINHVSKTGGDMLKDFEAMLKANGENRSVAQLLKLSGENFMETNANEAMTTGQAGFGAEFVQTYILEPALIERLSNTDSLAADAMQKTMSAGVNKYPVRGARRRMIGTTESNSYP